MIGKEGESQGNNLPTRHRHPSVLPRQPFHGAEGSSKRAPLTFYSDKRSGWGLKTTGAANVSTKKGGEHDRRLYAGRAYDGWAGWGQK